MFWKKNICGAVSILIVSQSLQAAPASPAKLIEPSHAEAIYRHLVEVHWSPRTGLFRSFPDTDDLKLSQQASTYEEAAMGLLAIRFNDLPRAAQLLQFFKSAWDAAPETSGMRQGVRGLANFYNADFGAEGLEKTIHAGPNAWVGLFAAKLANTTKDPEALQLALDIEYWMANVLPHEKGGVAMGPRDDPNGAPWSRVYSTENNLSYYAFLTELLRSPVIDIQQRVAITQERDHVEDWLFQVAYDSTHDRMIRGTNPQGRDAIGALDTATWLVAAVGPKRLAARGIDPFEFMESAAKSFEVSVNGRQGVDAADQAEADRVYMELRNHPEEINRPAEDQHRVIWYEGLGQYILSLGQLADYARENGWGSIAQSHMEKVGHLTREFDLAALERYPQQGSYPYATPGKFFRYGWGAPMVSEEGPASSLISGIWRCFAGLGYNPLSGKTIDSIATVDVSAPKDMRLAQRKQAVLYGTSDDMTREAWRALKLGDWDQAVRQSQATIQEWAQSATYLQKLKQQEVGDLIDYTGDPSDKNKIFKYWALNDVATAYYILGQALDHKADYTTAAQAFSQVVNHYSLAQVWDPQGWFWSPVEAISTDYVLRDRAHYGWVTPQEFAESSRVGKKPY